MAHFCKLPRLAAPPPVPAVFFQQIAPITAPPPVPAAFFLQIARIGPPPLRPLSKTIQPAFAAFCPVSRLHPFFAPYIFPAQISRLAKLYPFLHFSFVCKNQHFFVYRNFKGVFGFLFSRLPFQKTAPLLRVPKIRLYFNHTKRGGIFHFKPPKQHLKLKFIFLKSTQNLWKGFWENLTMCHILPHFAGKQCVFFN